MSFDHLAPHYPWMERILAGNKLQHCRTAFLNRIKTSREVLILGEGHGRFLVECRRQLPEARITIVDSSGAMMARAAAHASRQGFDLSQVRFVCADVRRWIPEPRRFDLIVTHFFLDCFNETELKAVIGVIAGAGTEHCAWLVSDFRIPSKKLLRFRALLIHRLMYAFFRRMTGISATHVVAPDPFLKDSGFALCATQDTEWGLLTTQLWRHSPATA